MTGGSPDAELVRRHLRAFDQAVTQLRRHVGKPVEALEQDLDLRWIVEHGLQLCAQNVLDIEVRLHHLQTVLRSGAPANPHRTTARRGPAPIAERLTK